MSLHVYCAFCVFVWTIHRLSVFNPVSSKIPQKDVAIL